MKILQISSELNVGSVGKIAEQIGEEIIKQGWKSYIAYGRDGLPSLSQTFKIGDKFDKIKHGIYTRITDRHAFASVEATKSLVKKIELIDPDIIHLQHLHGYYINIEILFNCLSKKIFLLYGLSTIVGRLRGTVHIMNLLDVKNGLHNAKNAHKSQNIRKAAL